MVRRNRFKFLPGLPQYGFGGLSLYWNVGLWRDVFRHTRKLNMLAVALEVAMLWLLGLAGGSFAVLHGEQQQYFMLPPVGLQLSYLMQTILMSGLPEQGAAVGQVWIGVIAVSAWLCLVAGTARLSYLVSRAYRSSLPQRSRWIKLVLHWLLTAVLLMVLNLALSWIGPDYLTPEMADDLRLRAAEGSTVTLTWRAAFWQIARWPATMGLLALGLAFFYRLSPQRWVRGAPLWPGIGLVLMFGSVGVGLGVWLIGSITRQPTGYGLLLILTIALLLLLWLTLLVPLGAQFNVSLVNQGAISITTASMTRMATPPPSFESFKINRGQDDRFPRE